jgi:hypothetical protein
MNILNIFFFKTSCKRTYVTYYVLKKIFLISHRDRDDIGGGFIFRNKIAQRFDQHASVPVPVPILRNINLIRNVYAKAERKNRMQKRDMISHIKGGSGSGRGR